jgi:hypothetical protein
MIYAMFLSFQGKDRVLIVSLSDYYLDSVRKLAADPANFPDFSPHPEDKHALHGLSLPVPWCNLLRGNDASLNTVHSILSNANPDYAGYSDYDSLAWDFDFLEPTGFDTTQDFLNAVQLASGYVMEDSYEPYLTHCILEPRGVLAVGYQVVDGDGHGLTWGDAYIQVLPQ